MLARPVAPVLSTPLCLQHHSRAASRCEHGSFNHGVSPYLTRCNHGLAQVIDNAREVWDKDESKTALRKRVSFVSGDFFNKGARLARAHMSLCTMACMPEHIRHSAQSRVHVGEPDLHEHMAPSLSYTCTRHYLIKPGNPPLLKLTTARRCWIVNDSACQGSRLTST